jgi:hypothetical protein
MLSNYTDEQLREELKRRTKERRKNIGHKPIYVEFEATIDKVENVRWKYKDGSVKYLPFCKWEYHIKDTTNEKANQYLYHSFKLKSGLFKKSNAPQVGDRVKLCYRKTKGIEIFQIINAKIIEKL